MNEEEPPQPEKISAYNSGIAQIKRLDELWVKTHRYAEGGLLSKYNWVLDRVWLELTGDLKIEEDEEDEEGKKKESQDKHDEKKFEGFKAKIGQINKDFIDRTIKVEEYKRRLYEMIMEKETFLRRLQQRLGKGTKLVDADEDTIE
jgi:hypothetical protein